MKENENQEPLHLGASLPSAGEAQPPTEPGIAQTPQIERVEPFKKHCGRLFYFRDGTRAELYDDGVVVGQPWDKRDDPAILAAITRWKKLRGWQPIQPKP